MLPPSFTMRPTVEWVEMGPDERPWWKRWRRRRQLLRLVSPLRYRDAGGGVWEVPAGFETDLASVPRLVPGVVRIFFGGTLETGYAAILHDHLYRTHVVLRARADELFWEALRATGETRVGAALMWAGVRAGGWGAWGRHSATGLD